MRKPRSAMPLPRYTERRWLKSKQTWGYLFHVPTWASNISSNEERGPCPVHSEALGTNYEAAVTHVETVLLPALDEWRTISELIPAKVAPTFDWMVGVYRGSPQYQRLSARQQANYEYGLRIVSQHALRANPRGPPRFGQLMVSEITPGAVDRLYAAIRVDIVSP